MVRLLSRPTRAVSNLVTPFVRRLPLMSRRLLAWSLDVALLAGSVALPLQLGVMASQQQSEVDSTVPLNPVLVYTQDTVARTLGLPKRILRTEATPLANALWSLALVMPILATTTHLYLLHRRGQSLSKACLGLRVVTADGLPPSWRQILTRELAGRWGLPIVVAYGTWWMSGAFPSLGLLTVITVGSGLLSGATAKTNGKNRAWYDRWSNTYVVATHREMSALAVLPSDPSGLGLYGGTTVAQLGDDDALTYLNYLEDAGGLTSVVLSPQPPTVDVSTPPSTTAEMRLGWVRILGLGLGVAISGGLAIALGYGWWSHQRILQHQQEQAFLALVDRLTQAISQPTERDMLLAAIVASQHPQRTDLLVDALAQATEVDWMEALQHALVSIGAESLPALQQLNASLRGQLATAGTADAASLRLRQQSVQRAIAAILTTARDRVYPINLNQVDLGYSVSSRGEFRLALNHVNLSGSQLQGAILTGAQLESVQFFGPGRDQRANTYDDAITDFSGADLTRANLTAANLHQAQLQGVSLLRSQLSGSDLSYANLSQANLSNAVLIEADLTHAVLVGARLTGSDLTSANFSQANLQGGRLIRVNGGGSSFDYANLSQADLQAASLGEASFTHANLSAANLQGADLTHANLEGADLRRANLQGAQLSQANLAQVKLAGANLLGAILSPPRSAPPASVSSSGFITAEPIDKEAATTGRLQGVDFSEAKNLSAHQLAYICSQGGLHPACRQTP